MFSTFFNIIKPVLSFFPDWLLVLLGLLVIFLGALFVWRLIK